MFFERFHTFFERFPLTHLAQIPHFNTTTFVFNSKTNIPLKKNRKKSQFFQILLIFNSQFQFFGRLYFSGLKCKKLIKQQRYSVPEVSLVPHTREPRIFCSVSNAKLKESLQHYGVKFTNYEGPASIVTYLTANCHKEGLSMASLVATIPAYVQGNNPKCVEAVTRRLAGILGLQIELDGLRDISDEFEKKLTDVVQDQPELASSIGKLEEDYDNEIFDSEMGDLKKWLQQQGVRLD